MIDQDNTDCRMFTLQYLEKLVMDRTHHLDVEVVPKGWRRKSCALVVRLPLLLHGYVAEEKQQSGSSILHVAKIIMRSSWTKVQR